MTENIHRGDIWTVRFDPSEGDEIKKIRPAVVMTAAGAGKIRLHIVVPVTDIELREQKAENPLLATPAR